MNWQIAVDTGGTFTDCLATDPEGNIHRAKVLSSGSLKAFVLEKKSDHEYVIKADWLQKPIFKGFSARKSGTKQLWKIRSLDVETSLLSLEQEGKMLPLKAGDDIEITAFEEAPVLAARLVTATPLDQSFPPLIMRLGSTRGTNALLEGKGAPIALLLTKGFKDLLLIGDQRRPDLFSLNIRKQPPLYQHVLEVSERLDSGGEVEEPLTEQEIKRVLEEVKKLGVEAVAISFMHSYLNSSHEQQLKEALLQAGIQFVSASAELSPAIKYLQRTETAVVNAYLSPVIFRYAREVQRGLSGAALKIMTSAGALVSADFFQPKDSLLSGPAGGVVGAAQEARFLGEERVLTLDMGGTSTDVARYDGAFNFQYEVQVGQARLQSKAVAIETVAAGGGSICQTDGLKLMVGPESAGAFPGPACYGAGGPITVTDVNLLLGKIYPGKFNIPLYKEHAQQAFEKLKGQLGSEVAGTDEKILSGLMQIANEKMAEAIRAISIRKGYDPQEYALLGFGGAGGQHVCAIAGLLGISKIIVPYDASILSALGIGKAVIERTAMQQVLKPLLESGDLGQLIDKLAGQARERLLEEQIKEADISISSRQLFLRFKGQDATIELDYEPAMEIKEQFKEKYVQLYGHWIGDREIELESVKVSVASQGVEAGEKEQIQSLYTPSARESQRAYLGGEWQELPVYDWDSLNAGAGIEGPALLLSRFTSVVLEAGWELEIQANQSAVLKQKEAFKGTAQTEEPEAVQLELFTNRFTAVAEEMGSLLERTAFSVNVKERLDFSCALLDPDGFLVTNAPHIPVHLGSLGLCTRLVLEEFPLKEGDTIITNHPGFGGSHLPDITMISGVFDADGTPLGYVANRAHHAEIGGSRPGSMPPDARSLAEEGVVISPFYLLRAGEAQWEQLEDLLTGAKYPSRAVAENLADLKAALAANEAGRKALQTLARQNGREKVLHYMQALRQYAHRSTKEALKRLGYGSYHAEEFLDDGSPLKLKIENKPEGMLLDFEGSAGVHPGNLNVNPAIVNSVVMYGLRLLIEEPIPLNEGLLEGVTIKLPEGMLNPDFKQPAEACPAVVGGNTEISQRLVDLLLKAFGVAACSQGSMNNLLFGNPSFGYYETIGGGSGAGPGFDGADGVHQHMTNTRITDPEIMEFRYPVKLEEFKVRENSGGKGKWNGGNGIHRRIKFLEGVKLSVLTQHRKVAPYGAEGGENGASGRQYIIRAGGETASLEPIDGAEVEAGDKIVMETPGGGGFGKKDV